MAQEVFSHLIQLLTIYDGPRLYNNNKMIKAPALGYCWTGEIHLDDKSLLQGKDLTSSIKISDEASSLSLFLLILKLLK